MSFDPDDAFRFMRCMYRSGLLDRFTAIQGEAMAEVMAEGGFGMGDLMNRMDQASDASVARMDRALGAAGPLFRYAASDRLMGFLSRLLDVPLVRRLVLNNMKKSMLQALTGEAGARA